MRYIESLLITSGLLLLLSLIAVSGCFITNCPPGGKRSGINLKTRQCAGCGPSGMNGRCYGPQICCSSQFGCLMGTAETLPCLQENHHTALCQNPGNSCSGNDESISFNGKCAANGLCCSTEICTFDANCHHKDESSKPQLSNDKTINHIERGDRQQQQYYKPKPESQFETDNLIQQILVQDVPFLERLISRRDRVRNGKRNIFEIGQQRPQPLNPSSENHITLFEKSPFDDDFPNNDVAQNV